MHYYWSNEFLNKHVMILKIKHDIENEFNRHWHYMTSVLPSGQSNLPVMSYSFEVW